MARHVNPSYEIRLYNHDRDLVKSVPRITKLKFGRKRNQTSVFSVALFGDDAIWASENLIPERDVSSFLAVFRTHPITGGRVQVGSYLIKEFNPWYDEGGQFYYQLGGFSPDRLLEERVLYPEEDLLYAGQGLSAITESGNLVDVMSRLVDGCMGTSALEYRKNPGFVILLYPSIATGGGRWDGEVLMDVLQDLASSSDIDFYVWHNVDTKEVEFHVGDVFADRRIGNGRKNKPFILSDTLGNLKNHSLIFNYEDEKNALYIKIDADDDTDSRQVIRMATESSELPYNRNEFTLNNPRSEDDETNEVLITEGKKELRENRGEIRLEVELQGLLSQSYLRDWNFGDKITVINSGRLYDMMIDEIEVDVTDGVETVTPSIVQIPETESQSIQVNPPYVDDFMAVRYGTELFDVCVGYSYNPVVVRTVDV